MVVTFGLVVITIAFAVIIEVFHSVIVTFGLVVMIIAFAVNMEVFYSVTVAVIVGADGHSNDVAATRAVRTKNAI